MSRTPHAVPAAPSSSNPLPASAGPAEPSLREWAELYDRLAADPNDALAWRAVERRVQRWARAVFWNRSPHMIADAVVDTCASVAVGMAGARGGETFAGFVYGHFLNVRRRLLKEDCLVQRCRTLDGLDIPFAMPEEHAADLDTLVQLRRALAALPARERRALQLRFVDELPAVSIAAELAVTNVNARRIVFNGLQHLRREFEAPARSAQATVSSAGAAVAAAGAARSAHGPGAPGRRPGIRPATC